MKGEEKHDVPYFRKLLVTETDRLNGLCAKWEAVLDTPNLSEEGKIIV